VDEEAAFGDDHHDLPAGRVMWRYSEYVLVIIAGSYVLIGIMLQVVRVVRHRLVARTA